MSAHVDGSTRRGLLGHWPRHLLIRAGSILLARATLRGARLGPRVGALGLVRSRIQGRCEIGGRVTFRGGMIATSLRVHPGATLTVGEGSVLNYGVSLEAHDRVEIGARCMIASMVRISDHEAGCRAPVRVGDDVWIAHGAIVAPGVSIGDGAVVSAGSVVTSDVPPGHLASGNPARAVPLQLVSRGPAGTPGDRVAR